MHIANDQVAVDVNIHARSVFTFARVVARAKSSAAREPSTIPYMSIVHSPYKRSVYSLISSPKSIH